MSAVIWIIVAVAVLAAFAGGGKNGNKGKGGKARIDHPHIITDDEYECPACGRRTGKKSPVCPFCGLRFEGTKTDYTEFDEEEDELEAWDEEDGI